MSETGHCIHCGAAQADSDWPKTCPGCERVSYKNPIPVAVAVVPVTGSGRTGLLVVRRDIEPQKGELALPGGYVDHAETWQEACAREVREETDVDLDPAKVSVFDLLSTKGGPLLIFCLTQSIEESKLPAFAPTTETSERAVIWQAQTMAFPLHTQVVSEFFGTEKSAEAVKSREQPNNPLHGITLKAILEHLVERHGWDGLAARIKIRCFTQDPSLKSSLKFLRKTDWARAKVERLYLKDAR